MFKKLNTKNNNDTLFFITKIFDVGPSNCYMICNNNDTIIYCEKDFDPIMPYCRHCRKEVFFINEKERRIIRSWDIAEIERRNILWGSIRCNPDGELCGGSTKFVIRYIVNNKKIIFNGLLFQKVVYGKIISRIHDNTQDAFYMVAKDADVNYQRTFTTDADGNKNYNSISFKYGTIESQRTIPINSTESYDVFQVRGDGNGNALFQFIAENTKVEFSEIKTGIPGDKGLNFITTSHSESSESGGGYLYSGQLYNGYTLREMNHSHPQNTKSPSGLDIGEKGRPAGTYGDIGFANYMRDQTKIRRSIMPSLNIYLPKTKSYINYGPK